MELSKKQRWIISVSSLLILGVSLFIYVQVRQVKKTSTLTQEEYYQELNGH